MPNAPPAMMTGPIARPSSPSVRFTAFDAPTITSIANGIHSQPRSSSQPLRNGIASTGAQLFCGGCQKTICSRTSVEQELQPELRPRRDAPCACAASRRSSHTPISPKPSVASITTHTYRLLQVRPQQRRDRRWRARMMTPPIVGVPFFVRWRSGVSSRIVSPPCCLSRSLRDDPGPDHQRDHQRRDQRHEGPERQVAEDVEEDVVLASGTRK